MDIYGRMLVDRRGWTNGTRLTTGDGRQMERKWEWMSNEMRTNVKRNGNGCWTERQQTLNGTRTNVGQNGDGHWTEWRNGMNCNEIE